MPTPVAPDAQGTSTRPYLIRALHDWCTDNGFTPYLAVYVDASVQVPMEYVKNHEIVLNVGFDATSGLRLGNEFVEFKARFGGVAREIVVPIDHVIAIYARENGQGMAFPVPTDASQAGASAGAGTEMSPGSTTVPTVTGLRLASAPVGDSPSPTVEPSPAPVADDHEPTPPPSTGGSRPSLKRVK
ncbi:Stringent starvation protein B [Leptothrix cholodnii SP-6]|uniref:Stringent starvation protein B n=1 Tax=Leptothrix cholodnii (strain ATCC 51168 / LMG 8142 / SP-6) TaxID=395495 RepID=B1Y2J0_LEPCP|nr:ClpXP protease specificity-enhancing factor [Leptothrix cholodnii]ACB33206.1 Stringent starvation protein B [Leptothrix cholodnii SP-6]